MADPILLLLALGLDALVGDPDWLWRRLPHPVVLFGALIDRFERWGNAGDAHQRRTNGYIAIGALVGISALAGLAFTIALGALGPIGFALEAVTVAILLAQRSLHQHVERVAVAARRDGLAGARRAVAMIVGRDPDRLNLSAVCRAAIESLSENFADGIVAPAFWYGIGGLPGLFAYKMVNTADSMIGHLSERYRDFGRGAARLDDLLNLVPARLSALLIALARPGIFNRILAAARADAPRHRSPNAGWPEASMAAAVGIALGGPRSYGDGILSEPVLNAGGRGEANTGDIGQALAIYTRACIVLSVAVLALAAF